jgi:methyl-accepting chemotaxis protein-1 (serine sensor receptor)
MIKNLKLRGRLLTAFGAVLVLTVALCVWSTWQLRSLMSNTAELSDDWLPSVEAAGRIDAALGNLRLTYLRLTVAESDDQRVAYAGDVATRRKTLDEALQAYWPLISSDSERALAEQMKQKLQRYEQDGETLAEMVKAGREAEARRFNAGDMRQHGQDFQAAINKVVQINHDGAVAEVGTARQTYSRALISVWVATFVVVSIGLAFAWYIAADLRRRVDQAGTAAKRFAAGDLTHEIQVNGADEVGDMLRAMADMRGQLAAVVLGVRENAESVATASAQISQGNADLSSRTEQQASALQQTAASMEQINGTAQNNADNAAQASQLAIQASGVADQGSRVVDGVVQTMRQIEQASRQVEEIISVIDGIAFQTNILALNAAVEAARAGEQGRGFAVVAGEVRSLAQRSAEAARQVKQLIATSVERVESGAALVDEAGSTMREVKSAVQRVSDIVGEIAAGSREQMSGVGQVSEAVTHMDQATQQNAALVEESAAAAESLRNQAEALVHAVAAFQTSAERHVNPKPSELGSPRRVQPAVRRQPARVSGGVEAQDAQWASF